MLTNPIRRNYLGAFSLTASADLNDSPDWLSSGGTNIMRVNATADLNITGVVPDEDGVFLGITNASQTGKIITIKAENATSSALNRFAILADIVLNPGEAALFIYTVNRWKFQNIGLIPPTLTTDVAAGVSASAGVDILGVSVIPTADFNALVSDHSKLVTEVNELRDLLKRNYRAL